MDINLHIQAQIDALELQIKQKQHSNALRIKSSYSKLNKHHSLLPYKKKPTPSIFQSSSLEPVLAKDDPGKQRICIYFLNNSCTRDQCSLSHSPTIYNTPLCRYMPCKNDKCLYKHSPVQNDSICRLFCQRGVCLDSTTCLDRHVFECLHFYESGF